MPVWHSSRAASGLFLENTCNTTSSRFIAGLLPVLANALPICVLLQFFRIIFNFSFPWMINREAG